MFALGVILHKGERENQMAVFFANNGKTLGALNPTDVLVGRPVPIFLNKFPYKMAISW